MKKILFVLLIGTLSLYGCQNDKTVSKDSIPPNDGISASTTMTNNSVSSPSGNPTSPQNSVTPSAASNASNKETASPENQLQKDITFVKKNIKKGLTKNVVIGIIGKNYSEVTTDGPDGPLWRYDLSAVPNYKFENPYNNDRMDFDGLKNKKLTAELFVHWYEDGTLKNYEMIYMSIDHENSIVRLNADGIEKVDPMG
jgi:hypothetical protein